MKAKTIFISDLHLGAKYSQPKLVLEFLKSIDCNHLVLVGDIIDFWALQAGNRLCQEELNVIQYILKLAKTLQVTYVVGNHDEILREVLLNSNSRYVGNIHFLDQFTYATSKNKTYVVLHGDLFDNEVANIEWLNKLGDIGYYLLLKINKPVQLVRNFLGYKTHWSLSQTIKSKIKEAVLFTGKFVDLATAYAVQNKVQGVICGHIHTAQLTTNDEGITYANAGDWVESFTYLFEDSKGEIQLGKFKS